LNTLVADNVGNFETKLEIHSIRHKSGFHVPNANLSGRQKCILCRNQVMQCSST